MTDPAHDRFKASLARAARILGPGCDHLTIHGLADAVRLDRLVPAQDLRDLILSAPCTCDDAEAPHDNSDAWCWRNQVRQTLAARLPVCPTCRGAGTCDEWGDDRPVLCAACLGTGRRLPLRNPPTTQET